MEREQGFYWVSEGGAEAEIALWQDGDWWMAGSEEAAPPALIRVLSKQLRPCAPMRAVA